MPRPIGTVFKTENPPNLFRTGSRWCRTTYEIVAHVIVDAGAGTTRKAEEIKTIDIEYFDGPTTHTGHRVFTVKQEG